jgi:hypothetical protein
MGASSAYFITPFSIVTFLSSSQFLLFAPIYDPLCRN